MLAALSFLGGDLAGSLRGGWNSLMIFIMSFLQRSTHSRSGPKIVTRPNLSFCESTFDAVHQDVFGTLVETVFPAIMSEVVGAKSSADNECFITGITTCRRAAGLP